MDIVNYKTFPSIALLSDFIWWLGPWILIISHFRTESLGMAQQQVWARAQSWKHKSASGVITRRIRRPGEWYLVQVNMKIWKPLSSPRGCSFLGSMRDWGHVKTMTCWSTTIYSINNTWNNIFFRNSIFNSTTCNSTASNYKTCSTIICRSIISSVEWCQSDCSNE